MMKRKFLAWTLLIFLAAVFATMFWQQSRYGDIRRDFAQDRQSPLYGQSLHVLTYLTAPPELELLSSLRTLRASAEHEGTGILIYAGKVVRNARDSTQLTEALGRDVEWEAIILQQFESREAYSRYLQNDEVRAALSVFPVQFAHGMRRSAAQNLLLPQALLLRRLQRLITFAPTSVPFEAISGAEDMEIADVARSMLPATGGFGEEAIVVVNLMLEGDAAQSAANAEYGDQMFSLFAEQEHGPIHVGASVPIDHPLDYTSVALVYYPGVSYFRNLVLSTFFQEIIGDKQLADTMVSITVPITNRL
ncbi:MAG: hypothetical protein AAGA46_07860 [Cyanobacteria bacterium P01_F01_bin.13]